MLIATVIWFIFGVFMLVRGTAVEHPTEMVTGAILIGATLITFAILGAKE